MVAGTLADLASRKALCLAKGAGNKMPLLDAPQTGVAFSRYALRQRFMTACKVLARERLTLNIHHGQHVSEPRSHRAWTPAEFRIAAARHATIIVTSAYLDLVVDDGVGR